MTPERRVVIALKVLEALRDNVKRADGKYSGYMKPNFQSVVDVLTLLDVLLEKQLIVLHDRFRPLPVDEAGLLKVWADAAGVDAPPDP